MKCKKWVSETRGGTTENQLRKVHFEGKDEGGSEREGPLSLQPWAAVAATAEATSEATLL